jgi:hypothetical protein
VAPAPTVEFADKKFEGNQLPIGDSLRWGDWLASIIKVIVIIARRSEITNDKCQRNSENQNLNLEWQCIPK